MDGFRDPLRFEPSVAGQRLVLPRRRARRGSVVTFLFGVVFAGLPGYLIGYDAWLDFVGSSDRGLERWSHLLPALFALPFVIVGGSLVLTSLTLWFSRTVIRIEGDDLIVKDGFGPFGLTRRRHADTLTALEITSATSQVNNKPRKRMDHFTTLIMPGEPDAKPFVVAVGYPRKVIEELAELLAQRLGTSGRLGPERTLPIKDTTDMPDRRMRRDMRSRASTGE